VDNSDWRLAKGGDDSAGLAYMSVSEKAWKAMEAAKNPRFYFDLRKERKNQVKGETAYTPAVALGCRTGAALDYLPGQAGGDLEKGRIALIDNAQVNARATRAGLVALGFTLFAPASPSAAATAVLVPEGMDSGAVVKALKARFSLVTANGQGTMQGKIFRVRIWDSLTTWTRWRFWRDGTHLRKM